MNVNVARECSRDLPSCFFKVICIWVVISSIYYISNLFAGGGQVETSPFHAAVKYFFVFYLSISIILYSRKYLLAFCIAFLFFPTNFVYFFKEIIFPESWTAITYVLNVIIVFTSMSGLIGLLRVLSDKQISYLNYFFVGSGIVVSLFACFQYFFLSDIFLDYWLQTGGVRLISTLLNPNNLGAYIGFCFIILWNVKISFFKKLFTSFIFLFTLLMSGSRSAWVALAIVFSIFLLTNFLSRIVIARVKIFYALVCVLLVIGGAIFFYAVNLEFINKSRFEDVSSILLRLDMYAYYFMSFDESYLFPDVTFKRYDLVNESMYFMIFNSLGLLGVGLLTIGGALFFSWHLRRSVWFFVLVYYLILGCVGNIINSFPNNQIFFISLGSLLFLRREYGRD